MIARDRRRAAARGPSAVAAMLAATDAARVVELESTVGGGSLPGETLAVGRASPCAVALADRLLAALRPGEPAVIGRIEDDACCLDLRTVEPAEDGGWSRDRDPATLAATGDDRRHRHGRPHRPRQDDAAPGADRHRRRPAARGAAARDDDRRRLRPPRARRRHRARLRRRARPRPAGRQHARRGGRDRRGAARRRGRRRAAGPDARAPRAARRARDRRRAGGRHEDRRGRARRGSTRWSPRSGALLDADDARAASRSLAVSSVDRRGIDELRRALAGCATGRRAAGSPAGRRGHRPPRDRPGLRGQGPRHRRDGHAPRRRLARGDDRCASCPAERRRVRVREVQVHGRTVERAGPGRTALNLAGVDAAACSSAACVLTDGPGGRRDGPDARRAPAGRRRSRRARPRAVPADRTRVAVHVGTAQVRGVVARSGRRRGRPARRHGARDPPARRARSPSRPATGSSCGAVAGRTARRRPRPRPAAAARRRAGGGRRRSGSRALAAAVVAGIATASAAARLDAPRRARRGPGRRLAPDVAAATDAAMLAAVRRRRRRRAPTRGRRPGRRPRRSAGRSAASIRRADRGARPRASSRARSRRSSRPGALVRDGDRLRLPGAAAAGPPPRCSRRWTASSSAAPSPPPPLSPTRPAPPAARPTGVRALERASRIVRLDDDLAWASPTYRDLAGAGARAGGAAPLTPGRLPRRDRHEPQVRHGDPRGPRPAGDPPPDARRARARAARAAAAATGTAIAVTSEGRDRGYGAVTDVGGDRDRPRRRPVEPVRVATSSPRRSTAGCRSSSARSLGVAPLVTEVDRRGRPRRRPALPIAGVPVRRVADPERSRGRSRAACRPRGRDRADRRSSSAATCPRSGRRCSAARPDAARRRRVDRRGRPRTRGRPSRCRPPLRRAPASDEVGRARRDGERRLRALLDAARATRDPETASGGRSTRRATPSATSTGPRTSTRSGSRPRPPTPEHDRTRPPEDGRVRLGGGSGGAGRSAPVRVVVSFGRPVERLGRAAEDRPDAVRALANAVDAARAWALVARRSRGGLGPQVVEVRCDDDRGDRRTV